MKSMRDELGAVLVEYGKHDSSLVVLDADLSTSTRTSLFRDAFPNRFFNLGIAEQNMIGTAVGLALAGKVVVVSGFTVFTLGRGWDFIRLAAHEQLPVKICTTHSGLSAARDGESHQNFEDIAMTCSLPNLGVLAPADAWETRQIVEYILEAPGPFYVRLTRNPLERVIPLDYQFQFGTIQEIVPGDDATIIGVGSMVELAISAAERLQDAGINTRVMNASTLKPLDSTTIAQCARGTGAILVVEEHNVQTGFGTQVSAVVGQQYPVPVELIGIQDTFGQSGDEQELRAHYGLTVPQIVKKVKRLIRRKQGKD